MTKLYNTQGYIVKNISKFLVKCNPNIRKTQLKIIPNIVFGMIVSESVCSSDIAKKLKNEFSLVQLESVTKRIKRFFKNKLFSSYDFYDSIIREVISSFKSKHSDKRVHIAFDHMFSHNNYVVFMITMRIGKQGIPLWFRCFKYDDFSLASRESLLMEGISYVSSLFDNSYNLIFLADRWFNSVSLMKHIDNLGHIFCIRVKRNIKVLIYDKKEKHDIWKFLKTIKPYKYHSSWYENVGFTDENFIVNLAISQKNGTDDPWIIVTNGDVKRAIKDYGYRFGAIETVFKNQKSNGFYLEKTVKADIKYFESMYTLACFSTLFLTIIGTDFSKNTRCYRFVKITTHKIINGKKTRIMSLFNVGLTLFNRAHNSCRYIRIPFTFKLYDI